MLGAERYIKRTNFEEIENDVLLGIYLRARTPRYKVLFMQTAETRVKILDAFLVKLLKERNLYRFVAENLIEFHTSPLPGKDTLEYQFIKFLQDNWQKPEYKASAPFDPEYLQFEDTGIGTDDISGDGVLSEKAKARLLHLLNYLVRMHTDVFVRIMSEEAKYLLLISHPMSGLYPCKHFSTVLDTSFIKIDSFTRGG